MKMQQYDLVEKISEGGSGSIYKAVNTYNGQLVAIKILHKKFYKNQKAIDRFQFEASQYLHLLHPNIVRLLDFNIHSRFCYLVMEFVAGKNLDDHINRITGPIPVQNAAHIMNQLLNAMQFAHDNQVLHLDIKPSNIMIKSDKQIKLLDFGIGRMQNEENDKMFVGSPYYMSPEQVKENQADITIASDIYSLGITFYQMLTGQVPFASDNNKASVLDKISKGQLIKPSDVYPHIPADIEKIIQKATALKKEQRYNSCVAFQVDINEALNKLN